LLAACDQQPYVGKRQCIWIVYVNEMAYYHVVPGRDPRSAPVRL